MRSRRPTASMPLREPMRKRGGAFQRGVHRFQGRSRFGCRAWLFWLALFWVDPLGMAGLRVGEAAGPVCVVCEKRIVSAAVYQHPRGLICEPCSKLDHRCWLCGLPVAPDGLKTADGRRICRFDAAGAVLTLDEAQRVFEATRAEVSRLTDGQLALKQPEVSLAIFDVDYWNSDRGERLPEQQRRAGFAHSKPEGGTWRHNVILYSGLPAAELSGICAHELTHLWINENLAPGRKLETDSLEALCEVVAFHAAQARNDARAMDQVRHNPYTRGKIQTAIELKERYGLPALLDWVRRGTSTVLEDASLGGAAPSVLRAWTLPATPKERPGTLRLKGVSGPRSRRMALINDQHFLDGDEKDIVLKERVVRVRCLRVTATNAVVLVDGNTNQMILPMGSEP